MGLKDLSEGYNESQEGLYTLRNIIFKLHEDTVSLFKLFDIYTNSNNSNDTTKGIIAGLAKKAEPMYGIIDNLYSTVYNLEPGVSTSDPDATRQVKELSESSSPEQIQDLEKEMDTEGKGNKPAEDKDWGGEQMSDLKNLLGGMKEGPDSRFKDDDYSDVGPLW